MASPAAVMTTASAKEDHMFGNPNWFRPKAIGWGLVPVSFKGWLYTGGWIGAIALPFLVLASRGQAIEALTWMTLGIGALAYDVRQILRTFRPTDSTAAVAATAVPPKRSDATGGLRSDAAGGLRDDNVLYIMDSAPGRVATQNYNLHVRR
jgi:hypothetical protein